MLYVFEGGTQQFIVRVDTDRNIELSSEKTNFQFVNIKELIKVNFPNDYKERISKLDEKISKMNNEKFKKYIKREFTTGMYTGYVLKNVIK